MAELTGGRYFRALDTNMLNQIYGFIDELEPVVEESRLLRPTKELFHWPLALAALLAFCFSMFSGNLLNDLQR